MEADSMKEWDWKKFAQSAALTAAGVGAGLGGAYSLTKGTKSPASLTKSDDRMSTAGQRTLQQLKPITAKSPERPASPEVPARQQSPRVTPHFGWNEFMSKDGSPMPDEYKSNILELANNLEVLRTVVGRPIRVVSGYRSPSHNKSVGGKSNSQHLLGKAADIKISGMSSQEVSSLIEKLINDGNMKQGGIGVYPTFVHYDIRDTKARW